MACSAASPCVLKWAVGTARQFAQCPLRCGSACQWRQPAVYLLVSRLLHAAVSAGGHKSRQNSTLLAYTSCYPRDVREQLATKSIINPALTVQPPSPHNAFYYGDCHAGGFWTCCWASLQAAQIWPGWDKAISSIPQLQPQHGSGTHTR